jgi:hypothetical protein
MDTRSSHRTKVLRAVWHVSVFKESGENMKILYVIFHFHCEVNLWRFCNANQTLTRAYRENINAKEDYCKFVIILYALQLLCPLSFRQSGTLLCFAPNKEDVSRKRYLITILHINYIGLAIWSETVNDQTGHREFLKTSFTIFFLNKSTANGR